MARGKESRWIAATAFFCGMLTLSVEIVGGRLMAPYFGSSLHQWAALIGVVLVAYVAGYGWHERLARGGPAVPLAAGGLYVLVLPFWVFAFLDRLLGLPLAVASVLGACAVAGVPSVLWAVALPYLQGRAGPAGSARILAWSAAGNLVGAWGVAFAAIPGIGTRASLLAIGFGAVLIGVAWVAREGARARAAGAACAALAFVAGGMALRGATERQARPWEGRFGGGHGVVEDADRRLLLRTDTAYQEVAVWDEAPAPGAPSRRVLMMNGVKQFEWSRDEPLTAGIVYEYYNFSTAALEWTASGKARNMLVLGLGGGLVPWQGRKLFPALDVSSFELDGELAGIARAILPLGDAGETRVEVGDARSLLRRETGAYDVILLDTFLNSYVPFHLTTREFFEAARARLAPGGVLVANFHTVFSSSGLLPELEATMGAVFPVSSAFGLPAGTTMVVASADGPPFTERVDAALRGSGPAALKHWHRRARAALRGLAREEEGAAVLTDDRNDTEQRLYETRRHVLVSRPI